MSELSAWDIQYREKVARRLEFLQSQESDHFTRVRNAWKVEGPAPDAHRIMQARLRTEWPTLAKALDEL